jgi:hypothetical protein
VRAPATVGLAQSAWCTNNAEQQPEPKFKTRTLWQQKTKTSGSHFPWRKRGMRSEE